MRTLRWRVHIASPPSRVWAAVTDFATMHRWFLGVRRVTLHAPAPLAGAHRTLALVGGLSHLERIGHWDPERSFSIEVLEPPLVARDWVGDIAVAGVSGGAELSWQLRYRPRFGLAGRVLDALVVAPVLNFTFTRSLRRLKTALEQTPGEE